jgi:hypothetical protein
MDTALLACAPFAAGALLIGTLLLVKPRAREAFTRRDDGVPTPEQAARSLVTHAARTGHAEALGISVDRRGGRWVVTQTFATATQAELAARAHFRELP